MKKIKFLWSLMALPLLAASCSNEDVLNPGKDPGNIPEGEGVYMTVNFTPFSKNTRSYTNGNNSSDGGEEVGTNAENKITRVMLVLATESNKFVANALVDGTNNTSLAASNTAETVYQAKAKFKKSSIQAYYGFQEVKDYISAAQTAGNNTNPPVRIFLYCNPNQKLMDYFDGLNQGDTEWVNYEYTMDSSTTTDAEGGTVIIPADALWGDNLFAMTNSTMAKRYFPTEFSTWNLFNRENNPFDLSGMNNRDQSNEVNNYTDGGTINVHRVAARFDFRDGSQGIGEADPLGNGIKGEPYTYSVIKDANNQTLVKAEIQTMSLVNMLRKGFYLERVSNSNLAADWTTPYSATNTNGYQLLEPEKTWFTGETPSFSVPFGGNYVVTPNPGVRTGQALKTSKAFSTYYQYPFFNSDGVVATRGTGWYTTFMTEFTNSNTHPVDNLNGVYKRWRYVTENTLAGSSDDQENASSTGIVFRARLLSGEALEANSDEESENYNYWDAQLKEALDNSTSNGPIIFAFSNNLYVSWKHVQYAALRSAGFVVGASTQNLDRNGTFYKAVFGNGGVGTITTFTDKGVSVSFTDDLEEDRSSANYLHSQLGEDHEGGNPDTSTSAWDTFRTKVVDETFTIYEKFLEDTTGDNNKDSWGYYCYYYYWNRHNDNQDNGSMAPMEFAVVRNNVYKLAVISLSKLGHPRIPENDPDDPKPDTPDEKSDLYMTVSVQVVPWVVRINNIEF